MKAAAFDYLAPRSLDEAVEALSRHGDDARLLAGGQSLAPVLALRLASPAVLIDLNRVEGLGRLEIEADGSVLAGAMVRSRTLELSPELARLQPLIHAAMPWVAHVQIRNRGTLGGSLSHADPSAELPAVAVACNATMHIQGPSGRREVAAGSFFRGLFTTALASDEILVGIRFPACPAGRRHGFAEIARRHGDYAMLGVALSVDVDAASRISAARVVLFGAADLPIRASAVEAALIGEPAVPGLAERVAPLAADGLEPRSDHQASAEYRRELAHVLVRRTLAKALAPGAVSGADR
ncbi:MAG: xanthine dehydrogenase family protein subunit M [Rhodocyclaceae bacterium]|nr:xanthine dehydrogenase family protein subunit M [Rhodocyclaceae bacterium]MCA3076902.1 xanthine dehydrogenase family protein subunit M [Rhodocyclaceae bacterium]MCA3091049.1 xanthine dehydrogenase family protein subunit M [Rhodocyclaceae bacterium]MCA3100222.1 xanthine dehydrogenase family protein subunit M [Rhodocyclaceae bacterium]MCA3101723.1 xanthine dehydrogenase family protein subunit M [Rhodocyclaceae bacterium]